MLFAVAPMAMAPSDQTYNQGDDVTLGCTAMGGPNNNFQWLLNGTPIPSETSSLLRLLRVRAGNGGVYTCMVTNAAGTSNATTSVFIALSDSNSTVMLFQLRFVSILDCTQWRVSNKKIPFILCILYSYLYNVLATPFNTMDYF